MFSEKYGCTLAQVGDVLRMIWATAILSVKNTINDINGFSMHNRAAAEAPPVRVKSLPS